MDETRRTFTVRMSYIHRFWGNVNWQNISVVLKNNRKLLIILLIPLITSLIPLIIGTQPAKCAYVVILMSIFWLTEALPLAITSLFPVLFYPLFGIMSAKEVSLGYFSDIVMLFYGGLVVANAIEITRLHERIALRVILFFGSDPKWLMLGFMLITAFLSLWISNTAATSMMLPVITAVVNQLIKHDKRYQNATVLKDIATSKAALTNENTYEIEAETKIQMEPIGDSTHVNQTDEPVKEAKAETNLSDSTNEIEQLGQTEKSKRLATGFVLCCAYSATIGGIGSLVGTAPNVLIKGYFDSHYPNAGLNFLTFMLYALPVSAIMLIISWIWLTLKWLPLEYILPCQQQDNEVEREYNKYSLKKMLRDRYDALGPVSWDQKCVAVVFTTLITLWITRDLHFMPGWSYFFEKKYISDATPAIFAVILLFSCPKDNIFKGHPYKHLIDWKKLQSVFPWGIVFLLGGGLVMADGFQKSGLSSWIGYQLKSVSKVNKKITLIVIMVTSATATEFTSNTSIATILLPIVDRLAKESGTSSIYLLLPLILSVSLAFMLPVATPNNAIIFSTGYISVKDMIITGFLMNIIGLLVIFVASNLWLGLIFDLRVPTFETNITNATLYNQTFLGY